MVYCDILFSDKLNRFYYGSTQLLPAERLDMHINQHYGQNKYTAKTDDWKLFLEIKCNTVEQARKIEKFTKVQSDKS